MVMPPRWMLKTGVVLVLLVAAAGYGYHHGAQRVQARWDRQKVVDQRAAQGLRNADLLRASNAGIDYEAKRAAAAARNAPRTPEAEYALHATICPPAGAFSRPLELGDVPVPGSELQRLRDAGADF